MSGFLCLTCEHYLPQEAYKAPECLKGVFYDVVRFCEITECDKFEEKKRD